MKTRITAPVALAGSLLLAPLVLEQANAGHGGGGHMGGGHMGGGHMGGGHMGSGHMGSGHVGGGHILLVALIGGTATTPV